MIRNKNIYRTNHPRLRPHPSFYQGGEFFHASADGILKLPSLQRRGGCRFGRRGGSLTPAEILPNPMQNIFQLVEDQFILESYHPDSKVLKEQFPFVVIFPGCIIKMNFSIQLDAEPLGRTVKIQNVCADAVLSAKFPAVQF